MFLLQDKSFVGALIIVAFYVGFRLLYCAVTGGWDEGVADDGEDE